MSLPSLLIVLASVGITSVGQLLLKMGMSSASVQTALALSASESFWCIATNVHVIGGLLCYGAGTLLWLLVLAHVELSLAFPFVGLSVAIAIFLAHVFLGEPLVMQRIAGAVVIVIGIVLVARS